MSDDPLNISNVLKTYMKNYRDVSIKTFLITFTYPIESVLVPLFISKFTQSLQAKDTKNMIKYMTFFSIIYLMNMLVYNLDLKTHEDLEATLQNHIIILITQYIFEKKHSTDCIENGKLIMSIRLFADHMTSLIYEIKVRIIPCILSMIFQSLYLLTVDPVLSLLVLLCTLSFYARTRDAIKNCKGANKLVNELDTALFEGIDEILVNY